MTDLAIAPPNDNAPMQSGVGIRPAVQQTQPNSLFDIGSAYHQAANTGDPNTMESFAKSAVGTPLEQTAKDAVETMRKNKDGFDKVVKPIVDKGGLQTPEGRMAVQSTWNTVKDHPQYGSALVEMLLGNPNARMMVTGGTVKPFITYDDAGNQLEEHKNELGQRVKVLDVRTGREISPQEYEQRRGGLDLKETLSRKQQEKQLENNVSALNVSNERANGYAASADQLGALHGERRSLQEKLSGSGLTNDQLTQLSSFTNRNIGLVQSVNNGFNTLKQINEGKSQNISQEQRKALSSTAQMFGLAITGSGGVTDANGRRLSNDELDNLQKNFSSNKNFEQAFSQSKEDAKKSAVYAGLNYQQKQDFDRIMDLGSQIEGKQNELASKYGTLPFQVNPAAVNIGDQFNRGEIQSIIGQFNATTAKDFADWRNEQLKNYPAGHAPNPNELEYAYTKTKRYQDLKDDFKMQAVQTARRGGQEPTAPSKPVAETPVGGMSPQATINSSMVAPPSAPSAAPKPTLADLRKKHGG